MAAGRPLELGAYALGAFFLAAFMLTRPTVFGEVYASVGIPLLFMGAAAAALAATRGAGGSRDALPQLAIYLAAGFYYFASRLLRADQNTGFAIGEFVVVGVAVAAIAALSLSPRNLRVFFDCFYGLMFVMAASMVATFALQMSGRTPSQLVVGNFDYNYLPGTGRIFAPFTFAYGSTVEIYGRNIVRLCGLFREPGIAPAFLCWAAGWAAARRWSWLFIVTPLLGAVASLSSLGLVLAVIALAGVVLLRVRASWRVYLAAMPVGAILIWAAYYAPYIGLAVKTEGDTESARERAFLMRDVFETQNWLLGDGLTGYRNETINLITSISHSGLVFVGLYLAFAAFALWKNHRFFIPALLPAVVTAVASQPIAMTAPMAVIFVSWAALTPLAAPPLARRETRERPPLQPRKACRSRDRSKAPAGAARPQVSNQQSQANSHVVELQSLRGIAATIVMLHHCLRAIEWGPVGHFVGDILLNAHAAVVIFFVLSGYVLVRSLAARSLTTAGVLEFYIRRIFRIYPALWIGVSLGLLYFVSLATWPAPNTTDWFRTLYVPEQGSAVALVATFTAASVFLLPTLWTIKVELAASVLLPLFAWVVRSWAALAALLLITVGLSFAIDSRAVIVYLPAFVVGAALTRLPPLTGTTAVWAGTAAALVLMFGRYVASFDYHHPLPAFVEAVAAGVVILAILGARPAWMRWSAFTLIGDWSYSIYLLHLPILYFFTKLAVNLWSGPLWVLALLVTVATCGVTILLARTVYERVELPGSHLGKRFSRAATDNLRLRTA
ncbi:acyltransferase [Phenylobacterium sp. J426]|uniref:acyltransferase family protein n=1 Tax=Phenylobacterium sp. J426 TaxID=2898439 RepID=UPI00215092D5|nr:acyltransferase [Phenylobacterium sp. J426]MCR5875182.1 acyltransferase [Phenylobacterium sp. J426]